MKKTAIKGDSVLSSQGFTLLELVISFAVISLIVLIVAGAMRLSHHSVESGEKKAEALERLRASIGIIEAQIQSQVPLSFTENTKKTFYFEGEREALQLATNYSIWGGEKGFTIVRYEVKAENDGKKTMFASEHTIGLEDSRETRLLTGFDTISFEYFYREPAAEEGSWVEQWTDEDLIPEKVRLSLVAGGRDFSMTIPFRSIAPAASQQTTPGRTAVPVKAGGTK